MKQVILLVLTIFVSGCGNFNSDHTANVNTNLRSCVAVNGKFMPQQQLDDLVLRAYGRKVLDDLVLFEVVRQYAVDKGIVLTDEMYEAELKRFLDEIAPDKLDSDQQAIFAFVLKKRGLTKELFDLILKKQALLRASVDMPTEVSEEQIKDEYVRLYGQKRSVLLLATSSIRSMDRAESELDSGSSFIEIVRKYSEDEASLRGGGLVADFSIKDDHLPESLRQKAFALDNVGDVSQAFQATDKGRQYWYKIRLESITPEIDMPMDKKELAAVVKRKEMNRRILELQNKLMEQAKIIIIDDRVK